MRGVDSSWGVGVVRSLCRGGALVTLLGVSACSAPAIVRGGPCTLLTYGDGRAQSVLAFPDSVYEALIRFDLPAGAKAPSRLWYRPATPGALQITVYASSGLDGPGEALLQTQRDIGEGAAGDAFGGRWMVEDLDSGKLGSQATLWVGFKKVSGAPGLWSSDKDAGHYYIRSLDPARHIPLVPVRRAPVVQLQFD